MNAGFDSRFFITFDSNIFLLKRFSLSVRIIVSASAFIACSVGLIMALQSIGDRPSEGVVAVTKEELRNTTSN